MSTVFSGNGPHSLLVTGQSEDILNIYHEEFKNHGFQLLLRYVLSFPLKS